MQRHTLFLLPAEEPLLDCMEQEEGVHCHCVGHMEAGMQQSTQTVVQGNAVPLVVVCS
jgi:hypothetical protein